MCYWGVSPLPQTANQTRQLAADTLEELHTQGEKLEKVDRDINDVRVRP